MCAGGVGGQCVHATLSLCITARLCPPLHLQARLQSQAASSMSLAENSSQVGGFLTAFMITGNMYGDLSHR